LDRERYEASDWPYKTISHAENTISLAGYEAA